MHDTLSINPYLSEPRRGLHSTSFAGGFGSGHPEGNPPPPYSHAISGGHHYNQVPYTSSSQNYGHGHGHGYGNGYGHGYNPAMTSWTGQGYNQSTYQQPYQQSYQQYPTSMGPNRYMTNDYKTMERYGIDPPRGMGGYGGGGGVGYGYEDDRLL